MCQLCHANKIESLILCLLHGTMKILNALDGLVLFSMTLSGDISVLPELEVIHLSSLLLTGDHKVYTFCNND